MKIADTLSLSRKALQIPQTAFTKAIAVDPFRGHARYAFAVEAFAFNIDLLQHHQL
jgi:hypothetical protein